MEIKIEKNAQIQKAFEILIAEFSKQMNREIESVGLIKFKFVRQKAHHAVGEKFAAQEEASEFLTKCCEVTADGIICRPC